MKLGTKINLVLVAVIAVTLTIAFWIIISIEGRNLKSQVVNDADAVTDILRLDIERMFTQIQAQSTYLQDIVDEIGRIPGVEYVTVSDVDNKYIAATNHSLIGQGISQTDLASIEEIKTKRVSFTKKDDAGNYYDLERYIPIFIDANDQQSKLINIIEVEVTTRSKSAADIAEAEKLLQVIVASVEQSARAIIVTRNEDFAALQKITDNVTHFYFFDAFVVFDSQLSVIANTGDGKEKFVNDPIEYKKVREDVLAGKNPFGEIERVENGKTIIMRVVPIPSRDEKTGVVKNIGLIEIHIAKDAYESRVGELRLRMFGVGIVFTAVLAVVLAIILEREVVGPIRRYSLVARKIADGDLNQKVEHHSNDEIGRFGEVFNSMVANLRELDKMKSDFISVAAHQLRTPLSGIKWVLKLLLDGDLGEVTEEQKGMLTRGYETGVKMSQLVDDLLNVSRIENDKYGYKLETNDFMKLLSTLVENTVLPSRERNIEVRFENRAGTIPDFVFDKDKLLIALQNIVDNAIKYTLPSGKVTIVVERQGDYVEVKVSDTGVGIPKAEIPKLFSKFFRAANVIHLQTDGSGLGLFIVKNIIVRHGGQLWVDSEEGKGTTMAVVIPTNPELLPKQEEAPASQVPTA
ncbi:MAG: ATP-binding protein [Candidatus Pacebacteria bacterium]|jgi:signal transduction histidine kinase|nr:ATP-binding protein [Candidatus Paceibacterota bacterium]